MSNRNRRRTRAVDKQGRNKFSPFVKLDWYLIRSQAYRSLRALPRAVYTELRHRFNGSNNGQISCSLRELVRELHCSKDSAAKALLELQAKGFVKQAQPGSFHYKVRHAATWILTEEQLGEHPSTNDFSRWRPQDKNAGPK